MKKREIRIGIITALEKEFAAMKALLSNVDEHFPANKESGDRYYVGIIASVKGGNHQVVLALANMGNNSAAIRASKVLNEFPNVRYLIMTGIAGGIPSPDEPSDHVRLGDIVVSDDGGVIQYDFTKTTILDSKSRARPRPPSATLLKSVRFLGTLEYEGKRPWLKHTEDAIEALSQSRESPQRPPDTEDVLADTNDPKKTVEHPIDTLRRAGEPKVHFGPIASSNTLLKNPKIRDELRNKFGVKAVEMEASGVADASWDSDKAGYLVVRGICDYCDDNKKDRWQMYAAVVAAAYTKTLIEFLPVHHKNPRPTPPLFNDGTFFQAIEEALKVNTITYFRHFGSQSKPDKSYTYSYFSKQAGWLNQKFDSIHSKTNTKKLHYKVADAVINDLDEISEQLNNVERLIELGLKVKNDHPSALTVIKALSLARADLKETYNQVWKVRGNPIDLDLTNSVASLGRQIDFLSHQMADFSEQTPVYIISSSRVSG